MKFTVAIDGPAASGKGTIARAVADRFDLAHLDTGLLYRAVGLKTLEFGRGVIDPVAAAAIAAKLAPEDLERPNLRGAVAARAASRVAALPDVRAALIKFQRSFARRNGGAVLDGRDIGTVICPKAEVKLFVTADSSARAERRFAELSAAGADTTLDRVRADIEARDARDSDRETAPLKAAKDAHLLDTTDLSIETAVAAAAAIIEQSGLKGRG